MLTKTRQAVALLVAVTDEAEAALAGVRRVELTQFPFLVGRQRSTAASNGQNNLYLVEERDAGHSLHVSTEHFAIEYVDGKFYLVDRGSACGTTVAGRHIGGNRKGGRTELNDGDEVIVGTSRSPYVFSFGILPRN